MDTKFFPQTMGFTIALGYLATVGFTLTVMVAQNQSTP